MSDSTSTSAVADGQVPDGENALQGAFVWVSASLATAVGIFAITMLVSNHNEREAGRMIIGAQKSGAYLPAVASQFARMHGQPNGF